MTKLKKPELVLAYEADRVGTLLNLLHQPIEALVDLASLREYFDYKDLTDSLTLAMADPSLEGRYLTEQWALEMADIEHLPSRVVSLLVMPAILNRQVGFLKELNPQTFNFFKPTDPLEELDNYIFRDLDVYRANEVLGKSDRMIAYYLDRLKACRDAAKPVTSEVLEKCLETPQGRAFHEAWTESAWKSEWYRKSVNMELKGGNNPVSNTITRYLLKNGPLGQYPWAYPKALEKAATLSLSVSHRDYLAVLDSFLSGKNPEALLGPEHSTILGEIYTHILQRLTMPGAKDGKDMDSSAWLAEGIREFHRLFYVPGSTLVSHMRENPVQYKFHLGFALNFLKIEPSAKNLGLMAEFVSAMTGKDSLFKTGQGTMIDSLAQFSHVPLTLLRNVDSQYGKIRVYLDKLFAGESGRAKLDIAIEKTSSVKEAQFYGRLFPELTRNSKNPWIQDQRISQDLGL